MNRYATRHSDPDPIAGRVLRRWVDTLISYCADLEDANSKLEAELAKKKVKAA